MLYTRIVTLAFIFSELSSLDGLNRDVMSVLFVE